MVRLERLQSTCARALLVLPALAFWPGARDAFLAPAWALAGVLAAVGFGTWMLRGAPGWAELPRTWRWCAAGWLGWLTFRVWGSEDPWMGAVHVLEWSIVAGAACAGLGLAQRERDRATDTLAVGVTLVSAIAIVEFALGRFPFLPGAVSTTSLPGRPGSTLGNPVFLGGWLAAVLPMLLAGRSRLCAVAAPVAAAVIVLTGSRGALLAAIAGAAWIFRREPATRGRLLRAGAGVTLALIALVATHPATLAHLSTPGSAGRAEIWRATAGMIRTAPVLGVGTGGFGAAYPCAQRATGGPAWNPSLFAHDEYLHALAELGPVGLVLLAAWLVVLLRARPESSDGAGAQGGVAALAIGALFAFPLHLPSTQILWWMLPSIWMSDAGSRRTGRLRLAPALIGALFAVVIAAGAAVLLVRNAGLRAGIAAGDRAEYAEAERRFAVALELFPDTARDRIVMYRALAKFSAGELGETETLLDADARRFPCTAEASWYRAFIGVMRVAAGQGRAAGMAEAQITRGLSLGPPTVRAAGFWTLRGHLRLSQGDRAGARQAYQAALELDPASRDARANLDRLGYGTKR